MKGPFSILHNRDAEKSNAHQPKKNLSNHFPKKINNPFTLVKILYTGISVREIPKNFGHFWLAYFFETDRNSLACLSNHFVKSKWFERCDTVTLWLMVSVTVKDSFGIFSFVQPCYYGIHGPTTVVLPYWPSFGFINAVFGVDHYWVMNIRICLFTLDLICRVFDPK